MTKLSATSLPGLTPLRGIAALGVAVFHFQVYFIRFIDKDKSMFVDKLYLMVDLFFIMSGFLIMHVYKEQFAEKISIAAFKKFIVARFARVYPLHLFTLLVLIALYVIQKGKMESFYDLHAIPSHLFLLHSFPLNNQLTWNIPSWSISAEWWSYMLFPLLCVGIFKNKKITVPLLLLVIITCYISLLYFVPRNDIAADGDRQNLDITYDYGFLRSIAGFTTGMLLYLFYGLSSVKKIFSSDIFCSIYVLLIIAGLHFGLPDIIFIPGFCVLILLVTSNTGKITAWFNNKALNFLGDISYSVYLLHFLLIVFAGKLAFKLGYQFNYETGLPFFKGAMLCTTYVLVLLMLSAISYRFVEKPCRKYFNTKWAGK
jgi:peptidoglycan/LPS O-acetylase OafA/YrhL